MIKILYVLEMSNSTTSLNFWFDYHMGKKDLVWNLWNDSFIYCFFHPNCIGGVGKIGHATKNLVKCARERTIIKLLK